MVRWLKNEGRPSARKLTNPRSCSGDGSSIRCRVVNLSEQGAAIELRDASLARPRFELMLERDRSVRKCRLVWVMLRCGEQADVDSVDHQ